MVDIPRQIAHWREGAAEEWQVSIELLEKGRVRHALFFAHLALEKALKAHVCRSTGDLAPRTHNLVRLAEIAGLDSTPELLRILSKLNDFSQIPCGVRHWVEDQSSAIIEIARREGEVILPDPA